MQNARVSELAAFVAIASHRSFRRAATELNVSSSALSHAMRNLEDRLRIRLLNRTTRTVSLTAAGERLLGSVRPAFADIAQALEELNALRDAPVGRIRLNAPREAARLVLMPILQRFAAAYPAVDMEVIADDRLVDIVADGFDAGVRHGQTLSKDMVALRFGPAQRFAVVAAPSYLARHPTPESPSELTKHDCISYRFPGGRVYRWEFVRGDERLEIEVAGRLIFEDNALVLDAARRGMGVGYVYEAQVEDDLASGALVSMLADWCPVDPGFFLYYPSRRNHSFAFRSFLRFLQERGRGGDADAASPV